MNPPVDAPASRQRRPDTSTAKRSRAASSFCPPRDTKRRESDVEDDHGVGLGHEAGRLVGGRPADQHRTLLDEHPGALP